MCVLTWLVVRWPWTVHLVRLERVLSAEIITRHDCGKRGALGPHQCRPPKWQPIAILALLLTVYLLSHIPHR